jgi:hypothetical protein
LRINRLLQKRGIVDEDAPEVMNEPLVSVVTPVYNTGEFIE